MLSRIIGIGSENGFSRFSAMMAPQNRTIINIFRQIGVDYRICRKEQEASLIEIQVGKERFVEDEPSPEQK